MSRPARPITFILAACNHGTMIVSRHDYQTVNDGQAYGVGYQLLLKFETTSTVETPGTMALVQVSCPALSNEVMRGVWANALMR